MACRRRAGDTLDTLKMSDADDPLRYEPIKTLRIRDAPMTSLFDVNPDIFKDPEIREIFIKTRNERRKANAGTTKDPETPETSTA